MLNSHKVIQNYTHLQLTLNIPFLINHSYHTKFMLISKEMEHFMASINRVNYTETGCQFRTLLFQKKYSILVSITINKQ